MRARLRDESGFALMGAMLILIILMGIGVALISIADNQQSLSGGERVRESGYNLAEAALNAEALQIGRVFPATSAAPSSCDPTTTANAYCPQATAIGNGYTTNDYASACPGSSTPLWQTRVRDNVAGEQYWTTAVNGRVPYDANADGSVWVRAFATVQCKPISTVALVTANSTPLTIADTVVTANWLTTSNNGRKVIIDTLGAYAQPPTIRPGPAAQPSKVVLRCTAPAPSPCANYAASKGQIMPPTVQTTSGTSPQALTATQLQTLESQASSAGSLWTSSCPSGSQLTAPASGAPVVVQGPCALWIGGGTQVNSATTPGVLVIENGTLLMSGTASFYGLIYMVNKQASSGSVVTISGNASIQGSVNIDGLGGLNAGSSKTNLVYDTRAATLLRGSTGVAINRGTVRTLPGSTP